MQLPTPIATLYAESAGATAPGRTARTPRCRPRRLGDHNGPDAFTGGSLPRPSPPPIARPAPMVDRTSPPHCRTRAASSSARDAGVLRAASGTGWIWPGQVRP